MKFSIKKINAILSIMTISMMSTVSFAQGGENIVPNGSFESIDKKPKRLGSIESANSWVSPTGARADLFVSTKVEDINVPMNVYGKETAKEGENYAGVLAYSYGNKIPRTYVMTKLDAPMKKGMSYCVKFNVSLSEASKYAVNNMAATFSKKAFEAFSSPIKF